MLSLRKTLLSAGFLCGIGVMQALNVENLRTEYLENPLGLDTGKPHFSWQLKSDSRSTLQQTYQVTIATDPAMTSVVFDSGVVESSRSANVQLENLVLQAATR